MNLIPDIGARVLSYAIKKGIKVFQETSLKEVRKNKNTIKIITNKKNDPN
jgi:hypothetical protein